MMAWRNKVRSYTVGVLPDRPDPDKESRSCWNADGTSKRGYDRRGAKRRAAQMAGPNWRSKGMQVYRCDECGWFHIGHNNWYGKSRQAAP